MNGMEGAFKDRPVQLPDQYRASQKLKHINEDIVQMSFEH